MKKLLILLCLTLGFSQTKLETRLFETQSTYEEFSPQEMILDIDEIVGFEVENAYISLYKFGELDWEWGEFIEVKLFSRINAYGERITGGGYIKCYDNDKCLEYVVPLHYTGGQDEEVYLSLEAFSSQPRVTYSMIISVTAEFPDMDTGYIEEGFEFCVEEGVNLTSFPCENDVALTTTFPQEALNNISSIVGQGEATINNNGQFFGSLNKLKASKGYWIISNSAFCYNYTCADN